ncbi:pyruvate oxidase [Loigolactobacillus bifermentans]|jgi:pyruvate oxidase|uniref:Pyruvate oxidase n=1 Tax=Loigolactobacillus bifermentans DSM 20003 TaxID=1423726 RepID=A0A0R1HA63_9LACO|nr:pyruvate oxidase [Loigolactobacillus bifermentans]KRK40948.1 pyruvate oxidase [Loigolactobacillus bifermentans DSM 20003]QGG59965.1 pyruvate oxidase [Loigolactobacillus bifermentans]
MTDTKTIKAADAAFKVIEEWGVDHVYGYPGGSFDDGMNALYNRRDTMKFIQVRHEEAGALSAAAEAKLTGKLGVTIGSAGPGAVHLLNGLYDAKHDHAPVLAIVAQVPQGRMNMDFFQAIDEGPIFDDVAVFNRTATTAKGLPALIDTAIRQAYKYNGVSVVIIPKDLGWTDIPDTYISNAKNHVAPIWPQPDPVAIDKAVELIEAAEAPMVYFGIGAKHSGPELKAVSEKFKMPLVSSVLAKGIVEDTYPAYIGSTGRPAGKAGVELGFNTDLILWVGNDVPFSIFLFNPKAKVIQIDIDNEKLGKRHAIDVPILADAKTALAALAAKGTELQPTPFFKAALADHKDWRKWQDSFKDDKSTPVRPEPVFDAINKAAKDDAVFGVDVGNININFMRLIDLKTTQKWTTSGQYASMGYGLPAAVAAQVAYPDRQVFSLSGDGGFAMMSQELLTAVKYNLPIINIVFSNQTLGYIEAEQRDDTHQPLSGVDLIDTDWATVADGMGVKGFTIKTYDDIKPVFEAALAEKGPVLIDVKLTTEMPLTTQHMFIDPAFQDADKVAEFKKQYQAEDLKPFSTYLKAAKEGKLD